MISIEKEDDDDDDRDQGKTGACDCKKKKKLRLDLSDRKSNRILIIKIFDRKGHAVFDDLVEDDD